MSTLRRTLPEVTDTDDSTESYIGRSILDRALADCIRDMQASHPLY